MVRVEVHNFQSVQDGVVDIDGFSVVVGRSNIGKSALVRAIKAALTGAPADSYVRHGPDCQRALKGTKSCKCFCSVRIQGPGIDLLWEKGDSVNRYVHNGTEHTVVGRGTPEFLGPGFAPIQIGGDTPTLLQVADQFRPLFILDCSGTAVADVLSDVAKLDQINEAARAVERDRRECVATRKVRDKDLRELDDTLAGYEGLDKVLARVQAVEAMGEAVAVLEDKLSTVERLATELASISAVVAALAPVEQITILAPVMVTEQATKFSSLARWRDSLEAKLATRALLTNAAYVTVPDISALASQGQAHVKLDRWTAQLAAIKALFMKFRAVETAIVPETTPVTSLYAAYQKVSLWADRVNDLESAVTRLQDADAVAESDEAKVLAEFKALEVCPTCRQPIQISGHHHKEPVHV